jgi:hypothetical protein
VADGRLDRLHRGSAAVLWGFYRAWHGPPEVTVTDGRSRGRPGLRVYRTRQLDPRETRRREGVPVTAPARTLLDLATLISERDLARAVEEAQVLRLVTPRELAHIAGRGRPGSAALRSTSCGGSRS